MKEKQVTALGRFRLTSDGIGATTQLLLPDGTDLVPYAKSITWHIVPDELAEVTVVLSASVMETDVIGQLILKEE